MSGDGAPSVPVAIVAGWPGRDAPAVAPPSPEEAGAALEDGSFLGAILASLREHHPHADLGPVEQAFALARRAHAGQARKSGEPYLVHPTRVAQTLADMGLDPDGVAAGLLHDSVEDSELTVFELTETFGRELAAIVDGVTKLGKVPYLSRREQQAESFRKMLLAMSRDLRVLVVKLADRLDNMRTLDAMPPDKRERISRETMEIYAPLAHRLGIERVRRELQDLSFRWLEPALWEGMIETVVRLEAERPGFHLEARTALQAALDLPRSDDDGVYDPAASGAAVVRVTRRWPYQLVRMQEEQGRPLDQAADLYTYQVVTRDRAACYAALGGLHAQFKPVPGRFRDYIALPRPNQYRALHTAVMDRAGNRLEVQLRSQAMDAVAERGVVAQWERRIGEGPRPAWLRQIVDWQDDVADPNEFIESVKADLFADEVYVFTPEGDIRTFPKGATPIDFAYAIHTDVGNHCSGARVNGHVVPLRYRLRQGDTIEIITNPTVAPRNEWLKMCGTPRARAKIKHVLRLRERDRLRALGRSLVEQELSSRGLRLQEYEERGRLASAAERLGLGKDAKEAKDPEAIFEMVGAGTVAAGDLVGDGGGERASSTPAGGNLFSRVLRRMAGRPGAAASPLPPRSAAPILLTRERVMGGADRESMIVLSPCCSPVPGDPLVGFVHPGRGIVAHVQGCPDVLEQVVEQRVLLAWEDGLELECPLTVEVRTADTVGLLAEMSRVFAEHGANIKQANCRTVSEGARALNTFHTTVRSLAQLERLILALRDVPGVLGVERIFTPGAGAYGLTGN